MPNRMKKIIYLFIAAFACSFLSKLLPEPFGTTFNLMNRLLSVVVLAIALKALYEAVTGRNPPGY